MTSQKLTAGHAEDTEYAEIVVMLLGNKEQGQYPEQQSACSVCFRVFRGMRFLNAEPDARGVNPISTNELRMTQDEPLAQQLIALGALLNEVEARLARAPAAPAGLEDLKNSVDSLRTSMWAVLAAGYGATAPLRVERLKLRRAIESLRGVQAGLEKQIRHPEHAELQSLARAIADQIGPTVGGK